MNNNDRMRQCLPVLLIPESSDNGVHTGRSSDLLRDPAAFPSISGQWPGAGALLKLTASGNVQDLHLVPFSFRAGGNRLRGKGK